MRFLLASQVAIVFVSAVVACSSSSSEVVPRSSDAGSSGSSNDGSSDGSSGATSSGASGSSASSSSSSSSGGSDGGGDAADAAPAPYVLTSSALAEGGAIALANVCTNKGGTNVSPPFTWTAGPAGTMSYAMVLTDKTNALVHWVLYDIPANATSLPADVNKTYLPANVAGAKQPTSYDNTTRGYLGPCPPSVHTYEFALYALDVATLPSATMASTRDELLPLIQAHDLAVAKLTGTFTP